MLNLDDLKNEMPSMPDNIKQMMEEEVAKQQVEKQEMAKQQVTYRTKRKMSLRKVVAIALAASFALGGTAFAGVKLYQLQMEKEGKYGLKAGVLKTESSDESEEFTVPEEIPVLSIEPKYLPDGMSPAEDGSTKYYYESTPYRGGISIHALALDEGISADKLPLIDTNVLSSESISINGLDGIYLEKDITTGNSISYSKKIYLAYPEYWQVFEIFIGDDVTKEEAMKVVENLKVTATDKTKSPAEMGTWSSQFEQLDEGMLGMEDKQTASADEMKNLHQVGDIFPIKTIAATDTTDWLETESINAKVTDVQIMDNISALDPALADDTMITDYVDANGDLLPNKIEYLKEGDGINDLDNIVRTEEVPQKLVYVTIELTNSSDIALKDILFNGTFNRATQKDGVYTFYNRLRENSDSETNGICFGGNSGLGEMVYYDFRGGDRNNNYIETLTSQESKTVHIAGIVNEDELDKMYLYIGSGGGTASFTEEALQMGYVDIRQ